MKRTPGARTIVRTGIAVLMGAGVAACGTSDTPAFRASPSATPRVSASTPTTAPAISPSPAPPVRWPRFSSASGKLSFRYDPKWKPAECAPNDSPLIVLGHNMCGQIEPSFAVDSVPSAQATAMVDLRCDPSQPPAASSSTTVDGVTGTREYIDYTAAAYNNCRLPIMHALVYSFQTGGRTYTVVYMYIPSEVADQTSGVDQMVQTLRFSA
jgi:hypothetical protein